MAFWKITCYRNRTRRSPHPPLRGEGWGEGRSKFLPKRSEDGREEVEKGVVRNLSIGLWSWDHQGWRTAPSDKTDGGPSFRDCLHPGDSCWRGCLFSRSITIPDEAGWQSRPIWVEETHFNPKRGERPMWMNWPTRKTGILCQGFRYLKLFCVRCLKIKKRWQSSSLW